MELKAALSKLKASRNKPLYFFYCEAGEDGKPVLLMDNKKIPRNEQQEVLAKAKKKTKCLGTMTINDDAELNVIPKGSAPTTLAKGIQLAARNNNAMVFNGITIGPPEEEESEGEESATGTIPPPPPPPPGTIPPPPPPPPQGIDKAAVLRRLNGLSAGIKAAIAAKGPDVSRIQMLFQSATGFLNNNDAVQAGKVLDELEPILSKATVPPPPPPPGTIPPPPPPPPQKTDKAAVLRRLNGLSAAIKAAIAAKGPDVTRIQMLFQSATGLLNNNDAVQAGKVLDELEPILAKEAPQGTVPPPPPPPPPQGTDKAGVLRRLNGLSAAIKAAIAAKGPDVARIQTLFQSATGLLNNNDPVQAGKVLDELEPVLTKAAPQETEEDEAEEGEVVDVDAAKFRAGWANAKSAWQDASDEVDGQINKLSAKLRSSDDTELKQIAEFGLNGVTGDHKVPLMAAIRELDSAPADKLKGLVAKAGAIAASFKAHIDKDERVTECDQNPFGVQVSIKKSIGGALDKLNTFFTTVKKG